MPKLKDMGTDGANIGKASLLITAANQALWKITLRFKEYY